MKQLITALKRLKGGKVSVKAQNTDIIHVNAAPNDLVIDLQHIEMVKDILDPLRELDVFNIAGEERQSIMDLLKGMKGFAEGFNEAQMTLRIQRMGEPVLVIGEQANPRLSRLILGNNIQANILKLTSLMRDLS
jgi:hypothetical protein